MVNGSLSPSWFVNSPTAVQFFDEAHETDLKYVPIPCPSTFPWMSASNSAGLAVSHSPAANVMVNARLTPSWFTKSPTAVQFLEDVHDTELKPAEGDSFCMSSSNSAGLAVCHSPSVKVMVNASDPPELFLKNPTAVQFPGDAHDTE
jgi:hypothetical protein